ncbi:MAG: response regulator transcription factor [Bacteroidetes bacterium]|nr:response regulator transcription factor [Bacteroidota bacterium]GDX47432.1 DNA-binding response regulator [Bacteroidota bacterium]
MIKIVIYDDNASRRESLDLLLQSYNDFIVQGAFNDCSNVEDEINSLQPDIVLMDIEMPNVDGISGVKIINRLFPNVKVIMQTVFEDDEKIFDALRFGASGYILKKTDPNKIIEAIREVMNGGSPMTPSIATRVLKFFRDKGAVDTQNFGLTTREMDILQHLVDGKSYKMISSDLNISYHTVNSHVKKIYDKLQVNSVSEAVSKALQQKIIR